MWRRPAGGSGTAKRFRWRWSGCFRFDLLSSGLFVDPSLEFGIIYKAACFTKLSLDGLAGR